MVNRRDAIVGGVAAGALLPAWSAQGVRAQSAGWRIAGIKRDNCSFFIETSNDFLRDLNSDPSLGLVREVRCPLCQEIVVLRADPMAAGADSAVFQAGPGPRSSKPI
ncbi:MAG: hypothetical protein AB7S92_05945 [Parvibaculaceae bacterium]